MADVPEPPKPDASASSTVDETFDALFKPYTDSMDRSMVRCCLPLLGCGLLLSVAVGLVIWELSEPGWNTGVLTWLLVLFGVDAVVRYGERPTKQTAKRFNEVFRLGTAERDEAIALLRKRHAAKTTGATELMGELGIPAEEVATDDRPADQKVLDAVRALDGDAGSSPVESDAGDDPRKSPPLPTAARPAPSDFIPLQPENPDKDER